MCVRASFNFFDAHRELECNQDPVSIFILYPNHFWKAITRRSKLIWLYQFHSISATPSVQINIVWVSVAMTAMCCSQTWVNGHSLHQGTPYVNRFRSQLLHLRTEGHQTRGVSRQLQSAIHRSSVSGVFWTESFRLNSWLRGFLMYLVYFGSEKTWWKLSNPTLY